MSIPYTGSIDVSFSLARVRDRDGRTRRIDFGMPRLQKRLSDSVFYLFQETGGPAGTPAETPTATGFFVARGIHKYAITNWHVCCDKNATILRLNKRNGAAGYIPTDVNHWIFDPLGHDLAALDVTDVGFDEKYDVCAIGEHEFASKTFVNDFGVTLGDDVVKLGLFFSHYGSAQQNTPSARFGTISVMPSEDAPIEQPNHNAKPSYLCDMRSRTGYSGSPVFSFRTPFYDLTKFSSDDIRIDLGGATTRDTNSYFRLLGVHCSQFTENVRIMEIFGADGKIPKVPREELRVESGMNVVIPAWEISALLEHPRLAAIRRDRENALLSDPSIPDAEAHVVEDGEG